MNHNHVNIVELLASQIFGNLLKHATGKILNCGFKYCMERNPCLQYKWRTFNLEILIRFAKLLN